MSKKIRWNLEVCYTNYKIFDIICINYTPIIHNAYDASSVIKQKCFYFVAYFI